MRIVADAMASSTHGEDAARASVRGNCGDSFEKRKARESASRTTRASSGARERGRV